jgi:hypothetical protein
MSVPHRRPALPADTFRLTRALAWCVLLHAVASATAAAAAAAAGAAELFSAMADCPGSLTELDLSGNPTLMLGPQAAATLADALGAPACVLSKVR